jgi:P-type Ca2+ transporter type 2C
MRARSSAYGRGKAMVVATGMATEFGRIARLLETVETGRTPLQENLDKAGPPAGAGGAL